MSGKGDNPRPRSISGEQYLQNWNNIFKPKKKATKKAPKKKTK